MPYSQADRLISIDTPLGKDVLLLKSFSGREFISHPFTFHLEMLSENDSIKFEDIVGKKVSIALNDTKGPVRYFNGFVSRFAQSGSDQIFAHYRAEVVPWLWFLTRTADCKIFQKMAVPDIITKVFGDLGFQDYRNATQGSFPDREYCVQYRETAFNFVSRLMEQEGIYYYFEHEKSSHTLVFSNAASTHKPCPKQAKARMDFSLSGVVNEDVVTHWQVEEELRTGKYALRDFNFETPSTDLTVNESSVVNVGGNSKYETYDYPGDYDAKSTGEPVVKTRMQEEESFYLLSAGAGGCRGFIAGYRFQLDGHSRKDFNKQYVLTEVQHSASVGESYHERSAGGEGAYSNSFSCIPFDVPYRPTRVTPKPFVQGPQTAIVRGKSGEEIYVDKYGRVKVQFHWDRKGSDDENSSCWIRVSQPWAGKNWGAMWIPRIGQEVIVDFLEGDPDRPIITGRVYNAEQMPPYALPANGTRSTFMSRSSKGGSSSNFNELRFEDKAGSEQIFLNAEKDMDLRVENDSREFVGGSRNLIVKKDQKEKVEGEQDLQITSDQNEKVGGDASLNVIGNHNIKVGQTASLNVGQNLQEKSGMNYAHEAGMEIHLKAGMNVIIEAGLELTLKASGGFITIGPTGVAISGQPLVMINSGGAAGSGSGSSPTDPKAPKDPDEADDGSMGGKK